jgi:hypothetical protein
MFFVPSGDICATSDNGQAPLPHTFKIFSVMRSSLISPLALAQAILLLDPLRMADIKGIYGSM